MLTSKQIIGTNFLQPYKEFHGEYQHDNLVSGRGSIVYESTGDVFTGTVAGGMLEEGLMEFAADGSVFTGTWSKETGKKHGKGRATWKSQWNDKNSEKEDKIVPTALKTAVMVLKSSSATHIENVQHENSSSADAIADKGSSDDAAAAAAAAAAGTSTGSLRMLTVCREYDGDWCDDRIEGEGQCTYSDGSNYSGEWLNSQRHGQGEYTYPSGSIYTGEWKNNKRHGKGTYTSGRMIHNNNQNDNCEAYSGNSTSVYGLLDNDCLVSLL